MFSYLICRLIQNYRLVLFVKQAVRTSLFNARTHSHISDKILSVSNHVCIAFYYRAYQFTGILNGRLSFIVLILKVSFGFRKVVYQIVNKLLLIFSCIGISVNKFLTSYLDSFTGSNILCIVSAFCFIFLISVFQITARNDKLRHFTPPLFKKIALNYRSLHFPRYFLHFTTQNIFLCYNNIYHLSLKIHFVSWVLGL